MRLAAAGAVLLVTFAALQWFALLRLQEIPQELHTRSVFVGRNGATQKGTRGDTGMAVDTERWDVCPIAPAPRTIFYNRIGKAGSSSLLSWISTMTKADEGLKFFHNDDTASERFTPEEEKAFAKKFETLYASFERNVVEKHTYWVDHARHGAPRPSYINMMRDPAKRWISQYHFWRELQGVFGKEVRELGYSIDECLAMTKETTTYTCPMANYQTLYLCGHDPEVCTNPVTEATFQRAMYNLVHEYDVVGPLEALDLYRVVLARMYPTYFNEEDISPRLPHVKNSGRNDAAEEEHLRLAQELNHYDYKLYEAAVALFRRRAIACGISEEEALAAVPSV